MPELPEVETIRRILESQIAGRNIVAATVRNPQVIAYPGEDVFQKLLAGQIIRCMTRRGKFLLIRFESGDRLALHLRMTGQLLATPASAPLEKHTHLILELSDGTQLRYIDVRRFGRFWYLRKDEPDALAGLDKLGAEPLGRDLTAEYLKEKLGDRRRPVKEMLHDQTVVAGIGNIYSDEILFAAGIYPGTKCVELKDADWNGLAEKIPEVLSWGIETNRMTAEEYLAGKGKEYRNMSGLRAYGREGQPCSRCQAAIRKLVIGGRSSCYCPVCQREKA